MGVGSGEVEVELVGVDLGEEISPAGERFQIKELVFFDAVHGFDIALIGMSGWRDAHMLASPKGFGKIAFEFASVVGLPDQITERDAVAMEMLLDAGSKNGAGRGAAPAGESPEQQPAAHFARGVLHSRQAESPGLRPVVGNIVEILGIRADLLKHRPLRFDVGQILFALIFAAAFFHQAVLTPDAFQRAVADGQIELADQAASAEGGQGLTQLDQRRFQSGRCFQRLSMTSAGVLRQAGRAVLLETAPPFADGGHGGGEEPRGGFDAALSN